ncbi:hypothetical protein C8J57DRAFT_1229681 [Mycena rebaudengoi]|nr:hypothetical protein C8J57DRAFT_1229681 [Mycena rebaudengoi]
MTWFKFTDVWGCDSPRSCPYNKVDCAARLLSFIAHDEVMDPLRYWTEEAREEYRENGREEVSNDLPEDFGFTGWTEVHKMREEVMGTATPVSWRITIPKDFPTHAMPLSIRNNLDSGLTATWITPLVLRLPTYTTTYLDEMHSCLQIYEIVGMICVNLDGGPDVCPCLCQSEWPAIMLKDFATLARTCRTLHGPSIDYLWRWNTPGNLVRLMMSDLWTEEVLEKGHVRSVLASSPD